MTVESIMVLGGTHGNELTGVRLIEQWATLAPTLKRPSLKLSNRMANQRAVDQRVRFVDQDLNRQFVEGDDSEQPQSAHEQALASTLRNEFGPDSDAQPDLIIDVHNTTSQMGATLILVDDDRFNQQMARYVSQAMPKCNVLLENEKPYSQHPYLCTMGKRGVMIEMGAQPQGVCRADIFADCMDLLNHILDFCEAYNNRSVGDLPTCEVYQFGELVYFPLDENDNVCALVAPTLQDGDFTAIAPGDTIFEGFDGSKIVWEGESVTYPHFINEAAYQQSHVAFSTANKIVW